MSQGLGAVERLEWLSAVAAADISAAGLRVAVVLAARQNKDTGRLNPSIRTIAEDCGVTDRAVRKGLRQLTDFGFLEVRGGGGNHQNTNRYRLLFPQPLNECTPVNNGSPLPLNGCSATPERAFRQPLNGRSPKQGIEQGRNREERAHSAPTTPRGCRLSVDSLPGAWREFCQRERPDLDPDRLFDKFADHWRAQPGQKGIKADWPATWRNWVRRETSSEHPPPNGRRRLSAAERVRAASPDTTRARAEQYARITAHFTTNDEER